MTSRIEFQEFLSLIDLFQSLEEERKQKHFMVVQVKSDHELI